MQLPFSQSDFFSVFTRYNDAVWPYPIIAGLLAVLIVLASTRGEGARSLAIGALGMLWIWMGIVYHWVFFTPINPLAWVFGALFVVQGLLLVWWGPVTRRMAVTRLRDARSPIAVVVLLAYALGGYPLVALAAGQHYPGMPTFGLPCPTVIFTFGVLLMSRDVPRAALIIPTLWAIVGTSAAVALDVAEDYVLLPAAIAAVALTFGARSRSSLVPGGIDRRWR